MYRVVSLLMTNCKWDIIVVFFLFLEKQELEVEFQISRDSLPLYLSLINFLSRVRRYFFKAVNSLKTKLTVSINYYCILI